MAAALKMSRVQRKGQITIPLEFRQRLGIVEGDYVAFTETEGGLLITPQKVIPSETLNRVETFLGAMVSRMNNVKKK